MEQAKKEKINCLYNKYYKLSLIIPLILLLFCAFYMWNFYNTHNDFIYKDISLKGGTSLTIYENVDLNNLKSTLSVKLEDLNIREISDLVSGERKALTIETTTSGDQTRQIVEEYLGHKLDDQNSSFEFSESSFTNEFYKQLIWANILAFILMSIVVFILFRSFVPSFTVISCVFIDLLMTLTFVNIMGIKLSTAGIIAFLMLIGYSVDTDILLTTRLMKTDTRELNLKIWGAFKTGITMTLTSLVAVIAALMIVKSFSAILAQIFLIITIGLAFDIINTWITNVAILKWYMERKK